MSQIDKLKALQSLQNTAAKQSSMTEFDNVVVVNIGVEPKQYFAKLRDENGVVVKDRAGRDKREETPSGWTYTFVEFMTAKTVRIVLSSRVKLELLTAYKVKGQGYSFTRDNTIFIAENGAIENL